MPDGSCLCGKVTYTYDNVVMKVSAIHEAPYYDTYVLQAICHCLTCRKLTGSTFATALLVPEDNLKTNISPPVNTKGVHESGLGMTFFSCDNCPSTLYKTAPEGFPGMKILFAGTLNGDEDIAEEGKPTAELWTKYRVPWLKPLEGCQQFEGFPPPN